MLRKARWTTSVLAKAAVMSAIEGQRARDERAAIGPGASKPDRPYSGVAKEGWPIYRTYVGLPDGAELVSDRATSVGRIRTIKLPPWLTEVNRQKLQTGHARFTGDGIGIDQVIVKRSQDNARIVTVETVLRSAFKGRRLPMPPVSGMRIPLGWDIRGEIRWMNVDGNRALHTLVAGMTGSGKTNTLKHLMGWFAELGWELWLGDPTGGSEFAEYEEHAAVIAWSAEDCALMLQEAAEEIERRYQIMGRERTNFWQGDPIVIFIDELPAVLDKTLIIGLDDNDKPLKQGIAAVSAMKKIVQRGRRARVTLIVGIQSPRAEDMSGGARGQFAYTVCHRVQRSIESVVCLGEGSVEEGLNAKNLPGNGRAFMMGLGLDTEQVQVFEARPATAIRTNGKRKLPPKVVTVGVTAGYGSNQGVTGDSGGIERIGTSGRNRNASPISQAQQAQQRLAKASTSKWAEPILQVLADYGIPMGAQAITDAIDTLGIMDQKAARSSVHRVLKTLDGGGLVYSEGTDWGITELGNDLITLSSTAQFYGDEDDD